MYIFVLKYKLIQLEDHKKCGRESATTKEIPINFLVNLKLPTKQPTQL